MIPLPSVFPMSDFLEGKFMFGYVFSFFFFLNILYKYGRCLVNVLLIELPEAVDLKVVCLHITWVLILILFCFFNVDSD